MKGWLEGSWYALACPSWLYTLKIDTLTDRLTHVNHANKGLETVLSCQLSTMHLHIHTRDMVAYYWLTPTCFGLSLEHIMTVESFMIWQMQKSTNWIVGNVTWEMPSFCHDSRNTGSLAEFPSTARHTASHWYSTSRIASEGSKGGISRLNWH